METRKLPAESLPEGVWLQGGPADTGGIAAVWAEDDQLRSAVWLAPAAESRFAVHAGLPPHALRSSLAVEAVWLARHQTEEALAPALYRGLQLGRVRNLNTVVGHISSLDSTLGRLLRLAELNAAPEVRDGVSLMAGAQMLDVAIHEAAARCTPAAWDQVRAGLPREAMATVEQWLPRFYAGTFTRSVLDRTMTREQYVQLLSNAHHYVRQTTQHLGRAVANSHDRDMRRHLVHHLNGEINHEVMIENDLRQLGADPEYVVRHRTPNSSTKAFMAIQEAAIGFYHDPLMLMACALIAEAVPAHMPNEFMANLRDLIGSWGIPHPERAMSFLATHSHVDSGEDGHLNEAANMLGKFLLDEATQRRFLCTLRAAAESFERLANSSIEELPLFVRAS